MCFEYTQNTCDQVQKRVIKVVKVFDRRAIGWDESAKSRSIVSIFKKDSRKSVTNYRAACLIAKRFSWWAEWLGLLDDNQDGFRAGRSSADVLQMMVLMEENVEDCKRRVNDVNEYEWPVARLVDLRKVYKRVSKPVLWRLLERYIMNVKCLETLINLLALKFHSLCKSIF